MKFKKTKYTVKSAENEELHVSGYLCGLFGIHKNEYGTWNIDHIPSGTRITFSAKLKSAKTSVEFLTTVEPHTPWETPDISQLRPNRETAHIAGIVACGDKTVQDGLKMVGTFNF